MDIHAETDNKPGAGRRVGVEVLNRSAIVLTTAMWEGYIEDLAAEAVAHLVAHVASPQALPQALRKTVNAEIKDDPHHLSAWVLAGDGWKQHLQQRLAGYAGKDANRFNTPTSNGVKALYLRALEIPDVTDSWRWRGMSAPAARAKLDAMVELRGDIAHGSGAAKNVRKVKVMGYLEHTQRLVMATDKKVNAALRKAVRNPLF